MHHPPPSAAIAGLPMGQQAEAGEIIAAQAFAPRGGRRQWDEADEGGLSPSRIVATSSNGALVSVSALSAWVAGTSNQLTVTDDGDGTITLSLPQNIHTAATPQFAGLTLTGSLAFDPDNSVDLTAVGSRPRDIYAGRYAFVGPMNLRAPGTRNTFLGESAGNITLTGTENTGMGYRALEGVTGGADPAGSYNTAFGSFSLFVNTTGYKNCGFGRATLDSNTTGYANMAIGYGTCHSNVDGAQNTAVGMEALHDNVSAANNTAVGAFALRGATGHSNTAVGVQAGQTIVAGVRNTAVGLNALYATAGGNDNTAIGYGAGVTNTGSGNIFLGQGADCSAGLSNVTVIATGLTGTASNSLYLGNGQTVRSLGHHVWSTDNTYDIGALGATRARTLYVGTSVHLPNAGWVQWRNAANGANVNVLRLDSSDVINLGTGAGSGNNLDLLGDTQVRIAAGGAFLWTATANHIEQRADATAQRTSIYKTYTDASNWERLEINAGAGASLVDIRFAVTGTGAARKLRLYNDSAETLDLGANGAIQWRIDTSGHLLGVTDNTYDIGASGATSPRTVYTGTSFRGPDGTASVVTLGIGAANHGIYSASAGADVSVSINGTRAFAVQAGNIQILSDSAIIYMGAGADTLIVRDAANVVALKNGTTAQTLRIYGTTTGSKHIAIAHDGNHSLITSSSGDLKFTAGGAVANWDGVEFYGTSANTYDLGTSTFTWRTGYFGTAVAVGTNPASAGAIRLAYATDGTKSIATRNATNAADYVLIEAWTANSVANLTAVGRASGGVILTARSGGAAPGTSDLAAGEWCLWRDTVGGTTKLYYNNAGAIESVALA